jgi:hypothetical protein
MRGQLSYWMMDDGWHWYGDSGKYLPPDGPYKTEEDDVIIMETCMKSFYDWD